MAKMDLQHTNTTKNVVELRKTMNSKLENLYINGKPLCVMGSVGEKDREAGLKAIQEIVDSCPEGASDMELISEIMMKVNKIANIEEKEIDPDEQVEVDGITYYISYAAKKAYLENNCQEVANIEDLPDLPAEAAKTILLDRIKLWAKDNIHDDPVCEDYDYEDLEEGY